MNFPGPSDLSFTSGGLGSKYVKILFVTKLLKSLTVIVRLGLGFFRKSSKVQISIAIKV